MNQTRTQAPNKSQTHIQIQTADFDLGAENQRLRSEAGEVGAIATFTGLVRDLDDAPLQEMFLEHYPGMTDKCLHNIVDNARERWDLLDVTVIHRVGCLRPKDQIVFVGVASGHRAEAFAACQFIMDYLKKDAPFWKKERTDDGEYWVEQKTTDLDALKRWDE